MRTSFVALAATLAIGACAHSSSAPASPSGPVDAFGALNGSHIELTAEGGIAALSTTWRAAHDDRSFVYSRRHLCGSTCPAPMDSASGVISAAAADSLFSVVWSQTPAQLRDDYGTTPGAADMFEYTLRVTFDGVTKTVRADDGTMPAEMRRIVDILGGTIDSARARAKP
jgi:hypothetical protein